MPRKTILTIIVIIFGIALFSFWQSLSNRDERVEKKIEETETEEKETEKETTTAQKSKEQVETIELKDISGGNAQVETSRVFKDGLYIFRIIGKKLPDPKPNEFYGVWFINDTGKDQLFIGKMKKMTQGELKDAYIATFLHSEDLRSYQTVIITLQTGNEDVSPENIIVKGSF